MLLQQHPFDKQTKQSLALSLWQKGLVLSDTSLLAQALQLLTRAEHMPMDDKVYLLQAKINISLYRFEQATDNLTHVVAAPQQVEDLKLQISRLSGLKDNLPLQSLDRYSLANKFLLIKNYIGWGQYEPASGLLAQTIDTLDQDDLNALVKAHLLASELAQGLQDHAVAVAHLQQAVLRLPYHVEALKALASAHQEHGHLKAAIGCLSVAKSHSSDPHLTGLLADAYALANKHLVAGYLRAQAFEQYQQALINFAEYYAGKAATYFAEQAVDNEMLRQAVQWASFDAKNRPLPQQWITIADIYLQLNDLARAKAALRLIKTLPELTISQKQRIKSILQRIN